MIEKFNNTVIEVLTIEHGKEVIAFWKSIGVQTKLMGIHNKADDNGWRYYGIKDNWFDSHFKPTDNNVKIITLEEAIAIRDNKQELPKRGDRILVWDNNKKNVSERIFITYIEGAEYPVVCVSEVDEKEFLNNKKFYIVTWKNWKPIVNEDVELTLEEIAEKFNIKVEQLKIKK